MRKPLHILWHITGTILFILFTILIYPIPPEAELSLRNPPFVRDLLGNAFLIAFFYLNYYWLIHRLLFAKRYLLYALLIVGCGVIIVWLPNYITMHGMMQPPMEPPPMNGPGAGFPPQQPTDSWLNMLRHNGHLVLLYMVVVVFSVLLKLQRRNAELQRLQLDAEREFLNNQINPHFLFNTLNSIYALSLVDNQKTPDALLNLSQFMRYAYTKNHEPKVLLRNEVEYITNYLHLQQMRFGDTVTIEQHIDIDAESNDALITPLILMTFIENAFKHGVHNGADNHIAITITATQKKIKLLVSNTNHAQADAHGVGIGNIRQQLQLLYPKKHHLQIAVGKETFTVNVLLDLA